MEQTQNKYNLWVLTIMSNPEYEPPEMKRVESTFKLLTTEYTFQEEVGEQGMVHYQCAVKTKIRKRQPTLLEDISVMLDHPKFLIQIDRSRDYTAAIAYCSDQMKRKEGTTAVSNIAQIKYNQEDIKFLDDRTKRYPWEQVFMHKFFENNEVDYRPADSRRVYWIADPEGCSGKSTFIKWLHCRYDFNTKVSFGSATQIRTAIIEKGPQKMYFIDIPRTLGTDDSLSSIYSVIEDTLNGYVETSMHGNPRELLMDPPHVIVFSNRLPVLETLSMDRWEIYSITLSRDLVLVPTF